MDSYGNPIRNQPAKLDVRVSKSTLKPALVVMDRFIKALEAHEFSIGIVEDYHRRGTYAVDGRDQVQIYIQEHNKRVEHVPTAGELREKEKYEWTRIPKWDEVPTGELVLVPGGVVDLASDDAINQLVAKAVADVVEQLDVVRKKRLVAEEAYKLECQKRMQIEDERKRVEAVFNAAEALRKYRIFTEYVAEVRRYGLVPGGQCRKDQSFDQWLEWADAEAKRMHPLGGRSRTETD